MRRGITIKTDLEFPSGVLHPGFEILRPSRGKARIFYAENVSYWPKHAVRLSPDERCIVSPIAAACVAFGVPDEFDSTRIIYPWASSFHPRRLEEWGWSGEESPLAQHVKLYLKGLTAGIAALSVGRLLQAGVRVHQVTATTFCD